MQRSITVHWVKTKQNKTEKAGDKLVLLLERYKHTQQHSTERRGRVFSMCLFTTEHMTGLQGVSKLYHRGRIRKLVVIVMYYYYLPIIVIKMINS